MLQFIDLTKRYGKADPPALQDFSLTVEEGEFVVLLGRSGAGKSTLIRCANGLIRPTSGEVRWKGESVTRAKKEELLKLRAGMGMIFQQFQLISRLDVLTNVMVGRFHHLPLWRSLTGTFPPEVVETAREALHRVGIGHLARQRADGLSGGQQQRVAIARVLVQRPKLLLGDEPVASLDPVTADAILRLLKEIHRHEKMTTILNLHDVHMARRVATRIVGIRNGRLVFDGKPEELDESRVWDIYRPDDDCCRPFLVHESQPPVSHVLLRV
ncbi:phosphonate transport system ATP-binding protein [Melghirimyces profundicolus]|uniref:Phosphonate transport system ATP-binding protein n=1 Tax=Melghirimyces profundicolus TaxID=1242148 RepID=A0A2T6BGE0_9BACL|nr:phosphonate ABC transporter ATP-binding protein [Melghirimyces profundicolus]PTX55135.1 phosphonate transport system ATP-binding protein [Melghirimyces profundicolus]